MKRIFTLLFLLISTITLLAQSEVRGVIIDQNTKESLIGATVVLKGTTKGTVSNVDGSFALAGVPKGKNKLEISYIGYVAKIVDINVVDNVLKLPVIELQPEAIGLNEISVLANIAIDRQTPIAVSNIKPAQIEEKLGTQEFPEILKSSPGIYATKRGGGFGDADVRIRGFGSTNVAVMINGMPVNGMEDDKVYWSNWAGLSDVTRTMQVQRGVGASKIAVPSVGGTINVITKTTDAKKGGNVFYDMGNDNYQKMGVTLSTGLLENNWALTMMFSKTKGDGYVQGTPFTGYSYFMSLAKKINDQHQLSLTVFGAPQNHAQRYNHLPLRVLDDKTDGRRYNCDWGYKNGQFYSNEVNFYHKPVAILNHYYTIDENTYLSSSIYASLGIGGGGYSNSTGVSLKYTADGQIDWDKVVANNIEYASKGTGGGIYFQNSYNYHQWYGALSTLKKKVGNFDLLAGVDLRYYKGHHWRQPDDLFGADFVIDKTKSAVNYYNKPVRAGETIYNDYQGEVMWEGLFLQSEYSVDKLSAFASATISNRSYRRTDYAQYFSDDVKKQLADNTDVRTEYESRLQDYIEGYRTNAHPNVSLLETEAYTINQVTKWQHFLGFSLKAGANYNLTDRHNVFINGGYMERQPILSTVFQDYKNIINTGAVNEKIISAEVGYGYRSQYFSGNLNLYYTFWKDKTRTGNVSDRENPGERLFYNIEGINARHTGIEFDCVIKPVDKVEITGMLSIGDWIWANSVDSVKIFRDETLVQTIPKMYLKGIHVADAAQTTAAIGINVETLPGLKIGIDMNYYDRLYADFNLNSRTLPEDEGVDVEKVPAYMLFDMNMYYNFKLGGLDASIFGNMNNVFNTLYISDAVEGDGDNGPYDNLGAVTGYYFGFGRTLSFGIKLRF